MTYEIHEQDGYSELRNPEGDVIAELDHPLTVPDDIVDIILDDMGIGQPQREAFRVLFTRDWAFVDQQP